MSANTEQRKLAAIMFTDMVGYSALSQHNEALALQLLEEHRALLRALFPRFNGREVKTIGDAFLVEFHSALEAAQCAIEIQRTLAKRNHDVPADHRIEIKIGIHIGDVVQRADRDVLGDGVNIASRIEPLAGAGGICISVDVERQIRNSIEASLVKLGATELKNIQVPMELFRIVLPWEKEGSLSVERGASERAGRRGRALAVGAVALLTLAGLAVLLMNRPREGGKSGELAGNKEAPSAALEKTRVIVLPLESRGKEDAEVGFAGGMTEALRGQLSKIAGLRVIDGSLLANVQGALPELARRCRDLNAGSMLRGSVQQIGGRLRIHLELLNSQTAEVLWPYEDTRDFKDIFAMQSDVAQGVASAVKVQLLPAEKQQLARKPTENLEAYKLYLQGRYLWNRRTASNLTNAIEYFKQAIGKDPSYALAYAGLADCYVVLSEYAGLPQRETMPKARAAALKALELDSSLAEPHAALATLKAVFDWDWSGAEAEFRQAIALNPNYPTAYQWLVVQVLCPLVRLDEALVEIKRAQELDPLSPVINANVGDKLSWVGKNDLGIQVLQKQIAIDPSFLVARSQLGRAYFSIGKLPEAIAELETMHRLDGSGTYGLESLGFVYARVGRTNEAQNVLGQLLELQRQGLDFRVGIALVQHALGDDERALASLEKAVEEHAFGLERVSYFPYWKDLRPHPRVQAILKRMNLVKSPP